MSTLKAILRKDYSQGRAITEVEIAVVNPVNLRQVMIKKTVQLDTGFDSGVHIRELEAADLATIGIKPVLGSAKLAGNIIAKAQYCMGYLQKIGNYSIPPPGIPITLVYQGTNQQGLLGLEAIKTGLLFSMDLPNPS
jgi:hypothetical protein